MLTATLLMLSTCALPIMEPVASPAQENRVEAMFKVLARSSASAREKNDVYAELTDLRDFELDSLKPYLRTRRVDLRAEAVFARVINDPDGGESFAAEVLREQQVPMEVKVAAMRGMAWHHGARGRVEALRQLSRAEGALLLEALDLIALDVSSTDIPYLIRVLEAQPGGRAESKAVQMLRDLTGYKMANDAKAWKYWMRYHKATGTPFFREQSDEENEEWTVSYFGLPIYGKDVVFVLDSSGSMGAEMEERGPGSRGQIAIKEVDQLLPRLPSNGSFGLVCFASEVRCLSSAMLERNSPSLARAKQWTAARNFDGGTDLFGGLKRALEFSPIEEIVLLSDGAPSVGERDPREIALGISNANRWLNLRISAVGIGVGPAQRRLLKEITVQNDGDLVLLR